MLMKHRVLAL